MKVLVAQSCLTLCSPVDCSLTGSSIPGKNASVGCHFLLWEIFLTQGLNPGLHNSYHTAASYLDICLLYLPLGHSLPCSSYLWHLTWCSFTWMNMLTNPLLFNTCGRRGWRRVVCMQGVACASWGDDALRSYHAPGCLGSSSPFPKDCHLTDPARVFGQWLPLTWPF